MVAPRKASAVKALLKRAAASLQAGDAVPALDVLLDLWARERMTRIREAISALSKKVEVTPLKLGGSQKDDYLAWTERARALRPIDVQLLAETLLLASARERAQEHFIRGRLKLLAKFPSDPRAAEMIELLDVNLPGLRWSADLDRALRRHALPPRPGARSLTTEVAEELAELEQALRAAALKPVGAPEAARPGAGSAEALLAAVLADPLNDELRLIAADKLAETGDPRGEFITLQFQRLHGTQSREGAEREHSLRKKYGGKWLGHLGAHVVKSDAQFAKGFPAAVTTTVNRIYKAREALALPDWSTVREIRFNDVSFFGPQMKSLEGATQVSDSGLQMLLTCEPPPPLKMLEVYPSGELCRAKPEEWKWPRGLARLTQLTQLELVWPMPDGLPRRPEPLLMGIAAALPPSLTKLGFWRTRLNPVADRDETAALLQRVPPQVRQLTVGEHVFDRVDGGWERRMR